ncbi:MAG TPA: hypothetical protein VJN70_11950 [Gemmatimonadaceae bacterium]|nr:hypothetical protein [Gemmatimonadaceae bacterium]
MNDPFARAIVARICSVILRLNGRSLEAYAEMLRVDPTAFRALVEQREGAIDIPLLIDVVSALVWESAVDPIWLLTGHYDSRTHRQMLLLGEDRSAVGARAIRAIVWQHFEQLRNSEQWLSAPRAVKADH